MLGGRLFGANKAAFFETTVANVQRLSSHMIRVTLTGDPIANFPQDIAGGHLKIIARKADEDEATFQALFKTSAVKREMRTYTIRHARPEVHEIDVDIVAHGDHGRVGPWAQHARPGDKLVISRPGAPKLVTRGVRRVLAIADMSGFPAAAAGLESLPEDITGHAFFEILSEEDRQPLAAPPGVDISWLVKADPFAPSTDLIKAVKAAPAPEASTSVFVAGESAIAAALRRYFRDERPAAKSLLYVSSYWKAGLIEPEHKIEKEKAA